MKKFNEKIPHISKNNNVISIILIIFPKDDVKTCIACFNTFNLLTISKGLNALIECNDFIALILTLNSTDGSKIKYIIITTNNSKILKPLWKNASFVNNTPWLIVPSIIVIANEVFTNHSALCNTCTISLWWSYNGLSIANIKAAHVIKNISNHS